MRFMYNFKKYDGREFFSRPFLYFEYSISRHLPSMMLDDTRCGLDTSSLHRATSMINYKAKKFGLLSCNRDKIKAGKF